MAGVSYCYVHVDVASSFELRSRERRSEQDMLLRLCERHFEQLFSSSALAGAASRGISHCSAIIDAASPLILRKILFGHG